VIEPLLGSGMPLNGLIFVCSCKVVCGNVGYSIEIWVEVVEVDIVKGVIESDNCPRTTCCFTLEGMFVPGRHSC